MALALAAGASPAPRAVGTGQVGDTAWTTYGGSFTRTSNAGGGPLAPLHQRWRTTGLGGAIYGEPLVASGRVFVATETDEVVALRAGDGRVAWRRSLGRPVPAGMLPCGDISPTVGVTSTMVFDPATGTLFVSAETLVAGKVHHVLDALKATTGRLEWRRDLDQAGWDPTAQLQRAALALAKGQVVVGFGGNYGDCGRYHGYVMAVRETGEGPVRVYEVPTAREGAVWAPSGVAVGTSGDIYAATGNGSSTTTYDSGDSVLRLSPALSRRSFFAPADWARLNASDADLGSAGPMLLPGGRLLIVGKDTTGYLLDQTHLGGIGHPLAATEVCFSIGGDAYANGLAYVACPGGSLTAVRVGARHLRVAWRAPTGVAGSPTIAGGLVWSVGDGNLVGLAPATGRPVDQVSTISTEHFAAPSVADGLLLVAGDGAVQALQGPAGYRP